MTSRGESNRPALPPLIARAMAGDPTARAAVRAQAVAQAGHLWQAAAGHTPIQRGAARLIERMTGRPFIPPAVRETDPAAS